VDDISATVKSICTYSHSFICPADASTIQNSNGNKRKRETCLFFNCFFL